jgi:hypothetical protein
LFQLAQVDRKFKHSIDGVPTSVEYTSEELSFLKKRSGQYAKSMLAQVFATDEYNDGSLDNYKKQEYIKKTFTDARAAAKLDLLFNQDENSDDYVEYPEFLIEDNLFTLKALGPYENSMGLRLRIDEDMKKQFIYEITKMNRGEPLKNDYFNNNN